LHWQSPNESAELLGHVLQKTAVKQADKSANWIFDVIVVSTSLRKSSCQTTSDWIQLEEIKVLIEFKGADLWFQEQPSRHTCCVQTMIISRALLAAPALLY
jgi:hypothetical protein